MNKKRLYLGTQILMALCIILSWILLFGCDILFPGTFGALPWIAMATMMVSGAGMVAFVLVCIAVYVLIFLGFYFGRKGKRWAMVMGTIALSFDMASLVVFTAFSWWLLIGILMDVLLMVSLWYLALKRE